MISTGSIAFQKAEQLTKVYQYLYEGGDFQIEKFHDFQTDISTLSNLNPKFP